MKTGREEVNRGLTSEGGARRVGRRIDVEEESANGKLLINGIPKHWDPTSSNGDQRGVLLATEIVRATEFTVQILIVASRAVNGIRRLFCNLHSQDSGYCGTSKAKLIHSYLGCCTK
jgi:hypothetical protein